MRMKALKRGWRVLLVLVAVFGFSGAAHAALIDIGTAAYFGADYKLLYDQDQKLVWLDYTNLNATWQSQMAWALGLGDDLAVTLKPGVTTDIDWSSGWRLPIAYENHSNLRGVIDSEFEYLFFISLGVQEAIEKYGYHDAVLSRLNPFENLRTVYWSGSEYVPDTGGDPYIVGSSAWRFNFGVGTQGESRNFKFKGDYAMAVHPGEVSIDPAYVLYPDCRKFPIPIPGAIWLLGSGLAGIGALTRRRIRLHG